MRALDLFCGAGGASAGLHRAGFEVTGIDRCPQPNYPFEFIQGDALRAGIEWMQGFDLILASPPCQAFTAYKRRPDHVRPAENLISRTREMLEATGVPFCIENVTGARDQLRDPVQLCGSSFGLDVRRHRLFEATFPIAPVPCCHERQTPRFPPAGNRTNLRSTVEVGVWRIPLETQRQAMGIGWMSVKELSQAIPPAYTEHIAKEFLRI